MKTITILGMLIYYITNANAAVSVGSPADADCQFNNIQAAIDSGDLIIRLSNQSVIIDNVTLNGQNHQLIGGYNSCADANNNEPQSEIPTEIMALDPSTSTISINGMNSATNVRLDGLKITGTNTASGLIISQVDGEIILNNSQVSNNNDDNGGGIFITGLDSHLIITNSIIQDNTANINGGGIYCVNAQLTLDAKTLIQHNKVFGTVTNRGRGGGLFSDDCVVNVYSGHSDGISAGFIGNESTRQGGAIAAIDTVLNINGQQETPNVYGDNTQPALFKDNLSDSDNDTNGSGAAIYMSAGEALIQSTWFNGNMGSISGSGQFNRGSVMHVERGAIVRMTADETQPCWKAGLCNLVSDNNHVLIYAQRPETQVTIEDTEFTNNTTEQTGMIWLRNSCCLDNGDGPDLTFENNLVHHNETSSGGLIKTDVSSDLCCEISLDVNGNTIADNLFNAEVIDINLNVKFNMHHNIVHEDAMVDVINLLDDPSTEAEISCLLVNNDEMIPIQATGIQLADPMFVDSESFDYHLLASSPAIDACDNTIFNPSRLDIDRQLKGNDIEDMIDINGPYDMGVDEYYLPDLIFSNNFE